MNPIRAIMTTSKLVDHILLKSLYIQGVTAKRAAVLAHTTEATVGKFFRSLSLTGEEIAEMYRNLDKIHKEYDRLSSFKIPKERRLEREAHILTQRIGMKDG